MRRVEPRDNDEVNRVHISKRDEISRYEEQLYLIIWQQRHWYKAGMMNGNSAALFGNTRGIYVDWLERVHNATRNNRPKIEFLERSNRCVSKRETEWSYAREIVVSLEKENRGVHLLKAICHSCQNPLSIIIHARSHSFTQAATIKVAPFIVISPSITSATSEGVWFEPIVKPQSKVNHWLVRSFMCPLGYEGAQYAFDGG